MRHRAAILLAFVGFAACSKRQPSTYQGYAEGEFVHVASPVGGRLDELFVERGQRIEAGAPLFALESEQEAAAVKKAEETLRAAEAKLADLRRGKRVPEIEVTQAQLDQAIAMADRSASQLARDEAQLAAGGISQVQLDESRSRRDVDAARVRELTRQIEVSRLGARPDQIRGQESEVAGAVAALDDARWRLDQKRPASTQAGLVFDTLFREGEWVPAGSPVVRMLPPQNVKVRFFVPEKLVRDFGPGRKVEVRCDGCEGTIAATVSYVSAEPEFTPPVIYSNETRSKLVFMIEARPAAEAAGKLRPGQPVQVALP